jgi:hypothetical protein
MIAVFADHHMGQGDKGSQAAFLQSGGQTPDDRSALRLGPPHVLVKVAKWRSRVERFFFWHHRDPQQKREASSIKMRWLGGLHGLPALYSRSYAVEPTRICLFSASQWI